MMSVTNSSEIKYSYHLVEFRIRGRPSAQKKWIDISLTSWFIIPKDKGSNKSKAAKSQASQRDQSQETDKKKPVKKAYVLFPPPPYTPSNSKTYNKYLAEKRSAPYSWEKYAVKLRGRAETLGEAHAKLRVLRAKEDVWSLSEDDVGALEDEAIDEVRRSNSMAQSQELVQSHQQSLAGSCNSSPVTESDGVCHSDDVLIIFNQTAISDAHLSAEDEAMQRVMLDTYISFAVNGSPSANPGWEAIKPPGDDFSYMHFVGPEKYEIVTNNNFGNKNFWSTIPFDENN